MINRVTIKDNEKFLRQVSATVVFPDKELNKDIAKLKKFCETNEVWAMAAVQIGIPKRIIYIKSTNPVKGTQIGVENEQRIYINPEIAYKKGKAQFWEACASCGDLVSLVNRPYEIEIKYYNENGKAQNQTLKGFESTVFSHEFDHLNGVLHMDIAEKTLDISFDERKALRIKEPYKIDSKDCELSK